MKTVTIEITVGKTDIEIPPDVSRMLMDHCSWQHGHGDKGKQGTPCKYDVEIPDHIKTA